MIRNNLSWINLNAGSSGGSGGGGVSDYNDLANRPIISMTGTSQNPLKLWNLSTGLYLLNGYVYYNTTNTRECVNLFVSITAQIQNGKYVLSAFVPSWEGHYEYIKANSTSTDYTDTQILKMLTEDDVLTLTNEVEYTPTTDYHPSTKKYVDEAMQSVMEEFAKMGVNEQDIKTLIAENRRRDIAIQALLNETADKNVTIEEDTHTISLDYSMEDGMATVNSIEGSTLVNVSKTVDEVYVTKSQDRVEQSKVANTIGEQNGKLCPIIEGDTLVNVCDQKDPIAITKSYTIENSGNHIALQGEYDGSCRPVIQGNTMVNLCKTKINYTLTNEIVNNFESVVTNEYDTYYEYICTNSTSESSLQLIKWDCYLAYPLENGKTYTYVLPNNIPQDTSNDVFNHYNIHYNGINYFSDGNTNICVFTVNQTEDTMDTNFYFYSMYHDISAGVNRKIRMPKWIMIFEGDLTQTPELIPTEYVEGLKSSFEDNVVTQAMVDSGKESAENLGKYRVEYKVTGKNKFDGELRNWSIDPNTGGIYAGGHNYSNTNAIKIKGGQYYKFTYEGIMSQDNISKADLWCCYYDNNMNFISLQVHNIITPQNAKYLYFYFVNPIIKNDWYIQIEEGSVATEYEPYKSYTKTFYLNSPLLEGDTIEDISGVATHVHRYGKVVLDGSDNEDWEYDSQWNVFIRSGLPTNGGYYIVNTDIKIINITWNGDNVIGVDCEKYNITSKEEGISLLQANPTTVVYQLASPIHEQISNESILCDSYVNGHLDFDSAVPIERVVFNAKFLPIKYQTILTSYKVQFESDNEGIIAATFFGGSMNDVKYNISVNKGINNYLLKTGNGTIANTLYLSGIGFNASNIVVTETTDKDFDYFNGIQSTFEENLVIDENNPHYGKYRVIYRTKSSDGNASTVKSVYLNSPLLQGDKLVVVNGKLCHYHKMGMVVLDGSEDEKIYDHNISENHISYYTNIPDDAHNYAKISNNFKVLPWSEDNREVILNNECLWVNGRTSIGIVLLKSRLSTLDLNGFRQWLQANPITVVYELAEPYYEEISSNPKDTVVDFYANGILEVQSAVYPLSMEFTSFEEELTYLYASTVYTVQFEANGNAVANITLGGATVTNQEIIHGLNKIQVTTPSTLVDNKLIIDGCGDCKISKVVVTNSIEEFEYFEGMKSAFEDKQNEDGTYTVEIVVYNAPIRLNKDKE